MAPTWWNQTIDDDALRSIILGNTLAHPSHVFINQELLNFCSTQHCFTGYIMKCYIPRLGSANCVKCNCHPSYQQMSIPKK